MIVVSPEDMEIRCGQIKRQVFAAGIGNRTGLAALFQNTKLRMRVPEVIKLLDGQTDDVSSELLSDIEGVFSNSAVKLNSYRNRMPSNTALNPDRLKAYKETQVMLDDKLCFSDYEAFARFAHVDLADLCLLRGGVFNIPKIETTNKRVNHNLASFLRNVGNQVNSSQNRDNGHSSNNGQVPKLDVSELIKVAPGSVDTAQVVPPTVADKPKGVDYKRNSREQAIFDRMERLGASRPRSLKRKRFMEASGISQPAMSNFLKGEAASWPRTLERIEAGLNVVEKEFGSLSPYEESADVVALETALEVSTSQPATAKAQEDQDVSEIPAETDSIGQAVQIADLLGVSLEDARFRVCFEEALQALTQLSQGKVEMIELRATSMADQPLRWRLVKGDAESMYST